MFDFSKKLIDSNLLELLYNICENNEKIWASIKKAASCSIGRSGENLPSPALTIIFCPLVGRLVIDIEAALDGIDEESIASFFVEIDYIILFKIYVSIFAAKF